MSKIIEENALIILILGSVLLILLFLNYAISKNRKTKITNKSNNTKNTPSTASNTSNNPAPVNSKNRILSIAKSMIGFLGFIVLLLAVVWLIVVISSKIIPYFQNFFKHKTEKTTENIKPTKTILVNFSENWGSYYMLPKNYSNITFNNSTEPFCAINLNEEIDCGEKFTEEPLNGLGDSPANVKLRFRSQNERSGTLTIICKP